MCAIFFGHNEQTRIVMINIDKTLLDDLFAKAKESDRLRMNYDLRTSASDNSQRMLNALLPGTIVPIHRHPNSNENVILLCGKLVEVIYDKEGNAVNFDGSSSTSCDNTKNGSESNSYVSNCYIQIDKDDL